MGEKRGLTAKIQYLFNTSACLEVQLPNEEWYRITPAEFRAYSYPRRISHTVKNKYMTEIYIGPTYLYGTNIEADLTKIDKHGLLFPSSVDSRPVQEKRSHGRI